MKSGIHSIELGKYYHEAGFSTSVYIYLVDYSNRHTYYMVYSILHNIIHPLYYDII